MPEQIDTVIVGGGQAGLATSYCLREHGRPHVILEQADRLADYLAQPALGLVYAGHAQLAAALAGIPVCRR